MHPGQARELALPLHHQLRHRPAGEVGERDAVAYVAAGEPHARAGVERHARSPVAWHAEGAAPAVRYGRALECGVQLDQQPRQVSVHHVVGVELRTDAGGEVVRRASPAEGDPAVGRTLAVDDHVPVVGEHLAALQANLVENALRQRLRGDHQRVQRYQRAPMAWQVASVALGRADDLVRPDRNRALRSTHRHRPRPHFGDVRALEDPHAEAFGGRRQPMREERRLDCRCLRRVARAVDVAHARHAPGLLRRQVAEVVFVYAERALVRDVLPGSLGLQRRAGEEQPATQLVVAVDAFLLAHAADLVNGVYRPLAEARGRVLAVAVNQGRKSQRVLGVAPAAVAAGGPEADAFTLEHDDLETRVEALEVVRGPQPREAGADDGDVAGEVMLWRRAPGAWR